MFPKPDRSNVVPNFSKTEENDSIDLGWIEGVFNGNRPYRCEYWTIDGVLLVTFFFSTLRLENTSNESLCQLLVNEKLIYSSIDKITAEGRVCEDASGNEIWSVNIVLSDEDTIYAEHSLEFKEYINFKEALFFFVENNNIHPRIAFWLPSIFKQGAEEAKMYPEELVMLAIDSDVNGDETIGQYLIRSAENAANSDAGIKAWADFEKRTK